ncbi:MAG: BMC domain-containing protein [Lachnospirales bacterium]
MMKENYSAIGIIDVSAFVNAIIVIDEVLKSSKVEIVSCEKRLGGRLVTIIIVGSVSDVKSGIDVARASKKTIGENNLKLAEVISNPHSEILKVFNLI